MPATIVGRHYEPLEPADRAKARAQAAQEATAGLRAVGEGPRPRWKPAPYPGAPRASSAPSGEVVRSAFEDYVQRERGRLYGVALRRVGRHHEAEDVTQEALLRAYQALDRFDASRPLGPWIRRIVASVAVDRWRANGHGRGYTFVDPADHFRVMATKTPDPLHAVLEKEALTELGAAMRDLPAAQRAVFTLRVTEELTEPEIATALRIPTGTVASRYSRARGVLRATLAPYFGRQGEVLR